MLTRSRPLTRPKGLCSGGAEHIPLAVSQTARVFVTTPIFGARIGDGKWRNLRDAWQSYPDTEAMKVRRFRCFGLDKFFDLYHKNVFS